MGDSAMVTPAMRLDECVVYDNGMYEHLHD